MTNPISAITSMYGTYLEYVCVPCANDAIFRIHVRMIDVGITGGECIADDCTMLQGSVW